MKKVTILLAIMTVCSIVLAQNKFSKAISKDVVPQLTTKALTPSIYQMRTGKTVVNNTNHQAKMAAGDTAFYDDFSTPANWVMSAQAPNGWGIRDNDGGWYFGTFLINSTSGGNFAILQNGAPSPAPPSASYNMTTANSIDFSNYSALVLSMQMYGAKFFDELELQYSTDGTNFTTIKDIIAEFGSLTQGGGSATDNPENLSINIGQYVGGQSTVWLRLNWISNTSNGITYCWMIDDILVTEAPNNDLAIDMDTVSYLHPWLTPVYTQIPFNQVGDINFGAKILNLGSAAQSNVVLNAMVSDGVNTVFNDNSPSIPLSVFEDSMLTVAAPFNATSLGTYSIDFDLSSDSVDANPGDNVTSKSFTVSDTIYARDDGSPTAGFDLYLGLYNGVSPPYEFGNWYEAVNTDLATSVSVLLGTGAIVGSPMQGKIYDDNLPNPTELATTGFYTIQSGDPGNWITLKFTTPYALAALSNYIVMIADFSGTDSAVTIAADPDPSNGTAWLRDNAQFWTIGRIPFVRLNLQMPSNVCSVTSAVPTVTAVGCNGGSDGAVSGISATGGATPYTYQWSGGGTNPDTSGMAAGVYTMTITDASSCTYTLAIEITEPDMLSVGEAVVNISCNGFTDGTVDASATGGNLIGSAAVTYFSEDFESSGAMPTGFATFDVDTLTPNAGIAGLGFDGTNATAWVVADDGSGSNNVAISTSYYDSPGTSDDWMITDAITIGGSNVMLSWDALAIDASFPDGYEVRISTTTQTVAGCLSNAALFTISAENSTLTSRSLSLTSAGYSNQTVYIAFRNTSTDMFLLTVDNILVETPAVASAYQYSFDGGAYSTTTSFTGLSAGSYNLIVKDASGCLDSVSVTVSEPDAITFALDSTTAVCGLNGSGTVTPSGGTAPFNYLWDDPDAQTDSIATGLLAGSYTIAVSDAMGCMDTAMLSVSGTPPVVMTTGFIAPTTCTAGDGIAYVNVASGTAPFGYQWSPTGGFSDSAMGLSAGIYTILVIDSFGCQNTGSVTIIDAGAPNINVTDSNDVNCFGGSDGDATATVSGGAGPYDFYWSNGDSTMGGGLTNMVTGLSAGSYTVTVTDANSCTNFANTSISEPTTAVMVDSISSADISCFGLTDGTGSVSASGGTGTLTYSWTSGGTTASVGGLGTGTEMVTVSDANGCSDSSSVTITEPAVLDASAVNSNIKCNGDGDGSIDLTATGGTNPLSYSWDTSPVTTTEDLIGLQAGAYSVTVTDARGCIANAFATISEPPLLVLVTTLVTNETNLGDMDGAIDMTLNGGTSPFTYFWTPGSQTTIDITGLAGGTNTLLVTDGNSCTVSATVSVAPGQDTTGIEEIKYNLVFSVYPNPNDGSFVVNIQNLKGDDYNLEVRNIIGQIVYSEVISDVTGKLRKEVNMKQQERGVYFLSIINQEGSRTEKLIIF
ncbi:MAG: hypothetical protein COB85_02725 [Bacteroidetes bacterium]|nr:MAG: hypothetical protein COB85_02725 [Bacteroidota bacterium]